MADQENNTKDNVQLLKRTRISVFVDEALPDILVVTYEFGVKLFKGVLLDSTKRNLPCGVPNLNPVFAMPTKNSDDDTLYSVNQRFAYTDPKATSKKKNVHMPSKYKNNKMTVRLRPRQVLCSKCKGICNENSENVSRKRKSTDTAPQPPPPPIKRGINAPITRSVHSYLNSNNNKSTTNTSGNSNTASSGRKLRGQEVSTPPVSQVQLPTSSSLVPQLTRLSLPDGNAMTIDLSKRQEITLETSKHSTDHSDDSSSEDDKETAATPSKVAKRVNRKKRSTGSSDGVWEEGAHDENAKNNNSQSQNNANTAPPIPTNVPPINNAATSTTANAASEQSLCTSSTNTRTIKISYGPQGEGTVLKIPAQIENLQTGSDDDDDDDSEENVELNTLVNIKKTPNTKAARRALKRAKKEARRKILLSNSSPLYLGNGSPRYTIGSSSPRYTVGSASPRHGLGNNSPRYLGCASYDFNLAPRRRKHKMKHKKKHRDERDRIKHNKDSEVSSTQDDTKEQCITQKLSINLKRLNNTYTSCPPPPPLMGSVMDSGDCGKGDDNTSSSSDEHSDIVPDFPQANPPLTLRINAQTMSSAPGADGVRLLVGDVVWGKILGFPWWPGKILTITSCGSTQSPQAHVAWYGSSTSSLMQCDQLSPYLDNFKTRYNKKKRGPYKEAIKQATTEARENAENRVRQPLGNSPSSHNIIPQVVPPALASPREIDVVS